MKSARLDALDREKRVLVARCADTRLQLARAAREVREALPWKRAAAIGAGAGLVAIAARAAMFLKLARSVARLVRNVLKR
jgi:hypothetical protein